MNLLYITNNVSVAKAADAAGVDEIFIDLEIHGKEDRQLGRNTIISKHEIEDIPRIKSVVSSASILVRCNPVGDWTADEIDRIINAGADTVMLPFFKNEKEVEYFMDCVAGRTRTCLLVETIGALENLDLILSVEGVDRIHIGLNDLHIAYKSSFMFEPFINGKIDKATNIARQHGVKFGIGGIAKIGSSLKPSPECLLAEHERLGSSAVILSRSFLNTDDTTHASNISSQFATGVSAIRECVSKLKVWKKHMFIENRSILVAEIEKIVREINQ
jgi:2-keto-3-deoxy-L-rhamnonate aldolase RhmA